MATKFSFVWPQSEYDIGFGTVGLDLGIGLGTTIQKDFNTCPGPDSGDPGRCDSRTRVGGLDGAFGIGAHLGLPVAVSTSRHAAFLIIPEVDFAYGQATVFCTQQ